MARKSVFSKDDIVEAALAVVHEYGIGRMTARGVADRLEASTAPVYSNFQNMEELESVVLERASDMLFKYMIEQRTENVFMNMGLGVLYFAREKRNFYRGLFLDRPCRHEHGRELIDNLLEVLREDPQYEGLSPGQRESLLIKMAIFTQGLATKVATGIQDDFCIDDMQLLLEEVGQILTRDAFERSRSEDNDADDATGCCR